MSNRRHSCHSRNAEGLELCARNQGQRPNILSYPADCRKVLPVGADGGCRRLRDVIWGALFGCCCKKQPTYGKVISLRQVGKL